MKIKTEPARNSFGGKNFSITDSQHIKIYMDTKHEHAFMQATPFCRILLQKLSSVGPESFQLCSQ
jgi:hypothetical protein